MKLSTYQFLLACALIVVSKFTTNWAVDKRLDKASLDQQYRTLLVCDLVAKTLKKDGAQTISYYTRQADRRLVEVDDYCKSLFDLD